MKSEDSLVKLMLELLLSPDEETVPKKGDSPHFEGIDWEHFTALALQNVVLIRCVEALDLRGIQVPDFCRKKAEEEKKRVSETIALIVKLHQLCWHRRIPHIFTKAFQHEPDMGHDVDLFVVDSGRRVDAFIQEEFEMSRIDDGSIFNRFSAKTTYQVRGYTSPVEIHHSVMGHVGEHTLYPAIMMENLKMKNVGGPEVPVPAVSDQLIIQVLQRIYGHLRIRIGDLVHTVRLFRDPKFDWDYVLHVTARIGVQSGLNCYLNYADQIYARAFSVSFLPPEIAAKVQSRKNFWGKVWFAKGYFRFPALTTSVRVFSVKWLQEIAAKNWQAAGRLTALPFLTLAAWLKKHVSFPSGSKKERVG